MPWLTPLRTVAGVPGASVFDGAATAVQGRALLYGVVDMGLDGCQLLLENQWTDMPLVGRFGVLAFTFAGQFG